VVEEDQNRSLTGVKIPRAGSRVVVICDPSSKRRTKICALIRAAGAEPNVLDDTSSAPPDAIVALVALADAHASINGRAQHVVAYADGADSWPVAAKCQPLLAGARKLLDSSTSRFPVQLQSLLREFFEGESAAGSDRQRISRLMHEHGIVGASRAIVDVFRTAARFSELSDLPVLITGETGTGKELLARAIAKMDPKHHSGPFVAVNCAAVPATMIESEVFGHCRGAFTGAERGRSGWIRAASGGALFLDEIGELDTPVQAKFLRVLQERRFRGVGEDEEVSVKTRFMAATNRDLKQMAREGIFREDLLNRLRILEVEMPSLKDRPEDIAILAEHFVKKHEGLPSCDVTGINRDYLAALGELNLRGNVRQLENIVRQSLVNHRRTGDLDLQDLPSDVLAELCEVKQPAAVPTQSEPAVAAEMQKFVKRIVAMEGWNLEITMRECERIVCHEALKMAHGNQTEAARLLGITSRSVYNKVHKFGMRP
jgi:transcriptional regulator with PAS, ATPase and Fis domain